MHTIKRNYAALGPTQLEGVRTPPPDFSTLKLPWNVQSPDLLPSAQRVPRKRLLTVAGISKSEHAVHNPQPLHTLPARLQVKPCCCIGSPPLQIPPPTGQAVNVVGEAASRGCGCRRRPQPGRLAPSVPRVTGTTMYTSPRSPKALAL